MPSARQLLSISADFYTNVNAGVCICQAQAPDSTFKFELSMQMHALI